MRRGLPLGPTLLVLVAVPVMLALGLWQLERREWKEAMLARLAAAATLPPLDHPDLTKPGLDFRRATVECRATGAAPRLVGGRSRRGEIGYSTLIPCGAALTLDAGWSARPDRPPLAASGSFTGMLREHPGPAYTLIADRAVPPLAPSAPPSLDEIPNNHLSYAVQWFLFAATLLAIYTTYVRNRRTSE